MLSQIIENKNKLRATLQLLATAMIWSSTFVLARVGVQEMGPLTLAGSRFCIAGILLLLVLKRQRYDFTQLNGHWFKLLMLGLLSFTIGNASIFFSSQYLPSTTVSLMMNFITPLVLIAGIVWLRELPVLTQYAGLLLALGGSLLYFHPQQIPMDNPGFVVLLLGLFGFAGYTILGRSIARSGKVYFLAQTAIPLLFGGGILLLVGLLLEGWPVFNSRAILILIWLILVNTILGYLLYNQAIAHLKAIQINVILNLTPFFTALIAWFLIGERISWRQGAGMLIIFTGTFLVQTNFSKRGRAPAVEE